VNLGSIFGTFFEDFVFFCEKKTSRKFIEKKVPPGENNTLSGGREAP